MVSTRRRQHSRPADQKYAVGDKVEVIRVKGLAVGYILSKAKSDKKDDNKNKSKRASTRNGSKNKEKSKAPTKTKGSQGGDAATTPHWIVSVEGGSGDEEVISETLLGRVLEEVESSDDSSQTATFDKAVAKKSKTKTTKGTATTTAAAKGNSKKGKSKTTTGTGASSSSPPSPKQSSTSSKNGGTKTTKNSKDNNSSGGDFLAEWERKRPVPRPNKLHGDYEDYDRVEEVHLNTGSLFMYRGAKHRRVEYVPRV